MKLYNMILAQNKGEFGLYKVKYNLNAIYAENPSDCIGLQQYKLWITPGFYAREDWVETLNRFVIHAKDIENMRLK